MKLYTNYNQYTTTGNICNMNNEKKALLKGFSGVWRKILDALIYRCDHSADGVVWQTRENLAAFVGCTVKTVSLVTSELHRLGFIRKKIRVIRSNGWNHSNLYTVDDSFFDAALRYELRHYFRSFQWLPLKFLRKNFPTIFKPAQKTELNTVKIAKENYVTLYSNKRIREVIESVDFQKMGERSSKFEWVGCNFVPIWDKAERETESFCMKRDSDAFVAVLSEAFA